MASLPLGPHHLPSQPEHDAFNPAAPPRSSQMDEGKVLFSNSSFFFFPFCYSSPRSSLVFLPPFPLIVTGLGNSNRFLDISEQLFRCVLLLSRLKNKNLFFLIYVNDYLFRAIYGFFLKSEGGSQIFAFFLPDLFSKTIAVIYGKFLEKFFYLFFSIYSSITCSCA